MPISWPPKTASIVEAEPEVDRQLPLSATMTIDKDRARRGARELFEYDCRRSHREIDEQVWSRTENEYVRQAKMVLAA